MLKSTGRLLVCLLLVFAMTTSVLAADPAAMTDIGSHWARDAIAYVMSAGLFNGVSATEFAPDITMSRAMFVTVLGRMAGVNEEDYRDSRYLSSLYSDVEADSWYAPYVCWATLNGIVNGTGNGCFSPDNPITREQMATIAVRYASIFNYVMVSTGEAIPASFADAASISDYAKESVDMLRQAGIMIGSLQDDGTYLFDPQGTATRAQSATLLQRLSTSLQPYTERVLVAPEAITLSPGSVKLQIGDYTNLTVSISPADVTNQTITWLSSDESVATVANGVVTAVSDGSAVIYACTYNGLEASCSITVAAPQPEESLAYAGESFTDKCMRIFGEVVGTSTSGAWRNYYNTTSTGNTSFLTTVTVRVWDFADSSKTTKVTKYKSLRVHQNIAATVVAIFDEIYASSEQPPINSVGGYRAEYNSEHDAGLAIDINPTANYYCYPSGKAITGTHWDPDNDPYSIPIDGVIENTFRKYGFTRGIYWRNGYKDYMHFSFFGW